MIAIILAAGYATRMYPLTENFPKPLLQVKKKPIIEYLTDNLNQITEISKIIIVTNHKYYSHFINWSMNYQSIHPIDVLDDGTTTNDNRLGAIIDIDFVLNNQKSGDDFFVLAADNLISFDLNNLVQSFLKFGDNTVYIYEEPRIEKLRKTGVAEIRNNRMISFEEKPQNPKSCYAVPPFYIYKNEVKYLIKDYISKKMPVDSPGSLLTYLVEKKNIFTIKMDGKRYDIGDLETYNKIKD